MQAILISIQSPHASNILNLIKLWEIRKRFPKDYVGWVYIYVTKGKGHYCYHAFESDAYTIENTRFIPMTKCNGKVVARFWCDKVEHVEYETCSRDISGWWKDDGKMFNHKDACLTYEEMFDYIGSGEGYAIHITNLEIFDKPKEIWTFGKKAGKCAGVDVYETLVRAPQSWCYIEV